MSDNWLPPPQSKSRSRAGVKGKRQSMSQIYDTPYGLTKPTKLEKLSHSELIQEVSRLQKAIQTIAIEVGLEPNEAGKLGFDHDVSAKVYAFMKSLKGLNP